MKQCPACNASFPNFHRVCDLDGTELTAAQPRQSLMKLPNRPAPTRGTLASWMLLTSLTVLGLFLSAVLVGFFKSPAPALPPVVKNGETPNPSPVTMPLTEQRTNTSRTVKHQRGSSTRNSVRGGRSTVAIRPHAQSASTSVARLRHRTSADMDLRHAAVAVQANSESLHTAVARQPNDKQTSREKSPKLVSLFKTTWKVLKKPFDF